MSTKEHVIGRDNLSQRFIFDFLTAMHTIVAGATRSGKSVFSYLVLMYAALDPRVKVMGVDPSGILLAPHRSEGDHMGIHLGTDNPEHMVEVAERAVRIMDQRIAMLMERGHDKVPDAAFGPEFPILLFVLEEYAGTLDTLKLADQSRRPADKLYPRMVGAVGRLLREGAKAGVRVLTILQKPEAATLHDRAQYSRRVSFRLDNRDAVAMLMESADPETTKWLMNVPPGMGLLHEAGEPMRRFRADRIEYSIYRALVTGAGQ